MATIAELQQSIDGLGGAIVGLIAERDALRVQLERLRAEYTSLESSAEAARLRILELEGGE